MTEIRRTIERALAAGDGILRLSPAWVPRAFLKPGGRLGLDPRDLYPFGTERGGIDERWLASTVTADNPGAPPDEGLSYVVHHGERVTLRDALTHRGPSLVGDAASRPEGGWPVLAKLFDNQGPIPLHLHQDDALASLVGRRGKPEGYFFPAELNADRGAYPVTHFGLREGVTRDDVRRCLARWSSGDASIVALSEPHALQPGTGWIVPPRILHAPGTLVTFEVQRASDVFSLFQAQIEGRPVPRDLLVKDVPAGRRDDLDWIVAMIDWPANTDRHFARGHFLEARRDDRRSGDGWTDRWVIYGRIAGEDLFCAKELRIDPGVRATIRDPAAHGVFVVHGEGRIGPLTLRRRDSVRFGEPTEDEVFVTAALAQRGAVIENTSATEPLVLIRWFGPEASPDAPTPGS